MTLTLGTAKITERGPQIELEYMNIGSFLIGRQIFGNHRLGWNAALRFCRERGLQIHA